MKMAVPDVFIDGFEEFWAGEPKDSNPYDQNTEKRYQWNLGWEVAKTRKEKRGKRTRPERT